MDEVNNPLYPPPGVPWLTEEVCQLIARAFPEMRDASRYRRIYIVRRRSCEEEWHEIWLNSPSNRWWHEDKPLVIAKAERHEDGKWVIRRQREGQH